MRYVLATLIVVGFIAWAFLSSWCVDKTLDLLDERHYPLAVLAAIPPLGTYGFLSVALVIGVANAL